MELHATPINPAPEGARCVEIPVKGGFKLRAMMAPVAAPRGTVVLLGGRSDYLERYFETMRELTAQADRRGLQTSRKRLTASAEPMAPASAPTITMVMPVVNT